MRTSRAKPLLTWLMLLFCAAGAGCSTYTLGTALPHGVRSIHVPAFINTTREPQLETETTRATRTEFRRDGTLELADADTADLILTVTLVDYSLTPIAYSRGNSKATREYRLLLTADLVLTASETSKEVLKRQVTGDSTFVLAGDFTIRKTEALPEAAKQLAHSIVESVVEFW